MKRAQKLNRQSVGIHANWHCPKRFLPRTARRRLQRGFRWLATLKLGEVFGAHGWIFRRPRRAGRISYTRKLLHSTPLPVRRTLSNIGVGAHYQIAFTSHTLQAIRADTAAYV